MRKNAFNVNCEAIKKILNEIIETLHYLFSFRGKMSQDLLHSTQKLIVEQSKTLLLFLNFYSSNFNAEHVKLRSPLESAKSL